MKFWGALLNEAAAQKRFSLSGLGTEGYATVAVGPKLLHPLFQLNHLKKVFQQIKVVGHSDELVFEQDLITENRDREDLIIIDRQVCDSFSVAEGNTATLQATLWGNASSS